MSDLEFIETCNHPLHITSEKPAPIDTTYLNNKDQPEYPDGAVFVYCGTQCEKLLITIDAYGDLPNWNLADLIVKVGIHLQSCSKDYKKYV